MKIKNLFHKKRQSVFELEVARWFVDNGDATLRLDYDLNEDSVVFDVGGYCGDWASKIFDKYICNIFCFEPVQEYANNIKQRFIKNNKVRVVAAALGESEQLAQMSVLGDSSSVFKTAENSETIKFVSFANFVKENKIEKIDLIKINIEGGEYPLLKHILSIPGMIENIDNIQIQFHNFIENAEQQRGAIREELKNTHKQTYNYDFVWENWKRK